MDGGGGISIPDLIPIGELVTFILTFGGGSWWLSSKFNGLKESMYQRIDNLGDKISAKIEAHERHDDSRFSAIQNDIWLIKLRNAARDNGLTKEAQTSQ